MIQETIEAPSLGAEHWNVVKILWKKRASWISELAWHTMTSEYEVKGILNELRANELVEEIRPDYNKPQLELLARVPEMSNIGQAGYQQFVRKRWFRLTKTGLLEAKKNVF